MYVIIIIINDDDDMMIPTNGDHVRATDTKLTH